MGQNSVNQEISDLYNWSDYGWEEDCGDSYSMDDYGMSIDAERQRIEQLLKSSVDLSPSAKEELEALQRKLNYIISESPEAQAADLAEIDQAINELDPAMENTKQGKSSLDEQMQDYLELHAEDLSEAEKTQIEKWIAAYQLDPEGTKQMINKEFQDLQNSIGTEEVYGSKIEQLADATGMKAAAVQEVFEKHGITDTQHLSDKEIQLVLPELGGKAMADAQKKLQEATQALQSAWDNASKQAEKVNAANRANEEDATNNNFNSFKTLSDIANHEAPEAKAYEDALRGVARASAPILAALKGVPESQVVVLSGAPATGEGEDANTTQLQDGMLQIGNEKYNVIGNPRTGETVVTDQPNPWPSFNSNTVKIFRNEYTTLPSWVNNQGYPTEGYKGEGGGSAWDFVPFMFF
jgi:hypothetical protein